MMDQALGVRRFVGRVPPPRPTPVGVRVVAAGKGGVGTSTASLLLAVAARRRGSVLLVDAQDGLATLDRIAGAAEIAPDAASDSAAIARAVERELVPGVTLVRPADDPDPLVGATTARRSALRQAVRRSDAPTVLVDAGSRPLNVVQAVNDFAAHVTLVVGVDGVSAPAAYALAKVVWHHRPEAEITLIVNRAGEPEARLAYDSVRTAARTFLDRSIPWLGTVPDAARLNGLPLDEWARIDEHEPALYEAAAAAVGRLFPAAVRQNSTLTLLK